MNIPNRFPPAGPPPRREQDEEAPVPGVEALRRARTPSRDLWPDIESRIRAPRRRGFLQPPLWLMAASVALVAALTTTVFMHRSHRGRDEVALTSPGDRLAPGAAAGRDAGFIRTAAYPRPMHPESRALVRANLKLVNNAEAQVRKALQHDPDAAYLQSLLASARQEKQSLQVALGDDGEGP